MIYLETSPLGLREVCVLYEYVFLCPLVFGKGGDVLYLCMYYFKIYIYDVYKRRFCCMTFFLNYMHLNSRSKHAKAEAVIKWFFWENLTSGVD